MTTTEVIVMALLIAKRSLHRTTLEIAPIAACEGDSTAYEIRYVRNDDSLYCLVDSVEDPEYLYRHAQRLAVVDELLDFYGDPRKNRVASRKGFGINAYSDGLYTVVRGAPHTAEDIIALDIFVSTVKTGKNFDFRTIFTSRSDLSTFGLELLNEIVLACPAWYDDHRYLDRRVIP